MAKQQVGLPISPNDYIGLKQSVIPIKMIPREPTTSDKKYRVGQVFVVGDNPSSGTEGDIWYLSKFDTNGDAIWSRFIGTNDYASTTEPGIIEIATDAEAVAGSSQLKAIVPSNLAPVFAEPPEIGGTTPGAITGTTVTGTTVTGTNVSGTNGTFDEAIVNDGMTVGNGGINRSVTINGAAIEALVAAHTEGASDLAGVLEARYSDTASLGSHLILLRSRGTEATPTVVQSGDVIGSICFGGYNGTDYSLAAQITCQVDGTPGSNDMPGRLALKVSPDGTEVPETALLFNEDKSAIFLAPISITGQTEHAVPVFGASGLVDEVGPLTDGQVLVGSTGSAPTAATITAGTGISVTNGAGSIEIANLGGTPTSYYTSANPVYATDATYTVDSFFVRNSDDDGDISKDSSTTLDVSTTGLNGVAVSSALSGTISASGTAVTGTSTAFTTDFQVGDVIYSTTDSTGRRITVITDDTNLTVESSWTITGGASYRRGGEAPSTHYYVYAVTDGSTPGLLMSTRSVLSGDTLVDEPSGYTKSRQMKYIMTNNDDSDLFEQIWAGDRCAYIVQYRTRPTITGKTIIYASGSGSYVTVSAAEFVPKTSKCVYVDMHTDTASSARNIRLPGSTKTRYIEGDFHHPFVEIPLSSDQEFQIQVSITTGIAVNGYRITEFV